MHQIAALFKIILTSKKTPKFSSLENTKFNFHVLYIRCAPDQMNFVPRLQTPDGSTFRMHTT